MNNLRTEALYDVANAKEIERLIANDDWKAARRLLQKALAQDPENHCLVTRLALTYYEERDYKRALGISEKAVQLAPRCPLVLWDYAGALSMVGREEEAIRIWKSLLKRGVDSVAYGECGEGLRWARRLLNDCRYRLGIVYADLGDRRRAVTYLRAHLAHRKPGVGSTYPLEIVRRKLRGVEGGAHHEGKVDKRERD